MKATTVYQLLMDMVKHEQNFGAYWIYLALKKGYLQKHDRPSRIYDVPFTEEELNELHQMNKQDVLGINRIKLYATEVKDKHYAFYFAENPVDAQRMHEQQFNVSAVKWHSVYKQFQHESIRLPHTEEWIYLFELKERTKVLPAFVGVWKVGEDK